MQRKTKQKSSWQPMEIAKFQIKIPIVLRGKFGMFLVYQNLSLFRDFSWNS